MSWGVIGGSGCYELPGMQVEAEHTVSTDWGSPSDKIVQGRCGTSNVYFLARHGRAHAIAPHQVNYRANIAALHSLGVRQIIAINAVGGINAGMGPGQIVIPTQIIDYSYGREHSFHSAGQVPVPHVDFTQPYTPALVAALQAAAVAAELPVTVGATYACTQGPRLETAAEIARLRRDDCDIVGMTAMPEAALARELGLDYAMLALVVNWAAGLDSQPITMAAITAVMAAGQTQLAGLLQHLLQA